MFCRSASFSTNRYQIQFCAESSNPASFRLIPHVPGCIKSFSSPQNAGDSVWWHCDIIHSVAPVENQQGWGNVMYIPAAPMCEKNLAYAQKVKIALEKGASPGDFPREDYEASWQGRFTLEDLNIHGKRALGMPV